MKSRLKPVNSSKGKKAAVENIFKLFGLVPLCDFSCHLVFVYCHTLAIKSLYLMYHHHMN